MIFYIKEILPGKYGRNYPRQYANKYGTRLGAHITGFQRLTYGIVALEWDGQNCQHAGMRDC